MADGVTHSGWLMKKAMSSFGKDNWKKRYFRLQGRELSYFEDQKSQKAKGKLLVSVNSVVTVFPAGAHKGKAYELELTFPEASETLYVVAANSAEDM